MLPKIARAAEDREALLARWDEELLQGGVTLSEYSTFLIESADVAYCAGADLAALITAQAAMEAHLRYECKSDNTNVGFASLIDDASLETELRQRLHEVRRFRNRWVHVRDPQADASLLETPEAHRAELADMATRSMRLLRELIYRWQCV